jgi:hypothetical protein
MSLARDIFGTIEYRYSRSYPCLTEGRAEKLFYLTHGEGPESVRKALQNLVRVGLVKCVLRKGPAIWNIAYRKGSRGEFYPTNFSLRLMKDLKVRDYFMEKGLY